MAAIRRDLPFLYSAFGHDQRKCLLRQRRLPLYWTIAMGRMQGLGAAAGLAFINMIGLVGAFVGPYLFGLAETMSGQASTGFLVAIVASAMGLALTLFLPRALRNEDAPAVVLVQELQQKSTSRR